MTASPQPHSEIRAAVADRLGRPLRDLRISVIDNCNLRCTYCMPLDVYGERYRFLPEADLLQFDEIERLAKAFVSLGVQKLRITGGEPLLRRDLPDLIARLSAVPGIEDIALTTNGLLLPRLASPLKAAGLHRITISLDAIDDDAFGTMNGRGVGSAPVLKGIAAAQEAGFDRIKVNAVVQRSVNESAALQMAEHFRGTGVIVRFIEYMDVGTRNGWRMDEVVPSHMLMERIHARYPLEPVDPNYRGEVASRYTYQDGSGEIGFISSVTEPFCQGCTRARVAADGKLYTCLFANEGTDLRTPLRAGASGEALETMLAGLWRGRDDRYSELRAASQDGSGGADKVEMYHIGG